MKFFLGAIAVLCCMVASTEQASLADAIDKAIVMGNGEAPVYQILETRPNNVEIRNYFGGAFASVVEYQFKNASNLTEYEWTMNFANRFARIGIYFAGYNNASLVMPLTGVTISSWGKIFANGSLASGQDFDSFDTPVATSASLFIPTAYTTALPLPNDRTVQVTAVARELKHAVITFGGYPTAEDLLAYHKQLVETVPDFEEGERAFFQVWSFDPWWKFWNRKNEIHMWPKNSFNPMDVVY